MTSVIEIQRVMSYILDIRCQVQITEDYSIWLVGYKSHQTIGFKLGKQMSLNQLCSCNSVLQPSSDKQYAKLLDIKHLIKTIEANV